MDKIPATCCKVGIVNCNSWDIHHINYCSDLSRYLPSGYHAAVTTLSWRQASLWPRACPPKSWITMDTSNVQISTSIFTYKIIIRYIWNIKCNTICPNKQNPYSKWDTVYSMWKNKYCTSDLFQHAHLNHTHTYIYNKYDSQKNVYCS